MREILVAILLGWALLNAVGAALFSIEQNINGEDCIIEKVYFVELLFPARLAACVVVWEAGE